jgi:hypothetical protein
MKPRAGVLLTILLILLLPSFGTELKPDRVISVTSLERREGNAEKPYKVNAKAWVNRRNSGQEPGLYYQLACAPGAGYLEVGSQYKAMEAYLEDGTKMLVIFNVKAGTDPKYLLGCDVESVKAAGEPKQ